MKPLFNVFEGVNYNIFPKTNIIIHSPLFSPPWATPATTNIYMKAIEISRKYSELSLVFSLALFYLFYRSLLNYKHLNCFRNNVIHVTENHFM